MKRCGIVVMWCLALGACATLPTPPRAQLDHVAVGVPDLHVAMAQFAQQTGVQPRYGGAHPTLGTENALVALGGGQYLELLGPKSDGVQSPLRDKLRALTGPKVMFWVVKVEDADAAAIALRSDGFKPNAVEPGTRQAPDGTVFRWRAMDMAEALGTQFFFIEWAAGTVHPATSSPTGCTLTQWVATTPQAARVRQALRSVDMRVDAQVDVRDGVASGYDLQLHCNGNALTYH